MSTERETCPVCGNWIFWIDGVCDNPECEAANPSPERVETATVMSLCQPVGTGWTGDRYPYGRT